MKISNLRTVMINLPFTDWIIKPDIKSFGCLLVFIDTEEKITGESFLWTFGTKWLNVLNAMVINLKDYIIGENPHNVESIRQKLISEIQFLGVEGISILGVSAIDRACWDIIGKAEAKPLYKLFRNHRNNVPIYASGLWLHREIDDLVQDAKDFVDKGYKAIKMRIGKSKIEEDLDRIKAVKDAIGEDIKLMVDANQRLSVEHAIKLGRKLEGMEISWFEDPVSAYDLEGTSRIAEVLDIPIVIGENIFSRYDFRRVIELKAADIIMLDLARVGGITEFIKIAHMAEIYNIIVTPHLLPEESMHLVGAIPNCNYVENTNWFSSLYVEKMEIRDGMVMLPERAGFGFRFNPDIIEKYRID